MRAPPPFHMHTALAQGLKALLRQLEERLALQSPLKVFLAGGMAVHLYTASRVTTDVDAEFGSRVFLPSDLVVDETVLGQVLPFASTPLKLPRNPTQRSF